MDDRQKWELEERRREKLISEFKTRESTSFFAMVVIGFLFSSTEYFVYFFFIFLAIFGAFQISFMSLIKDLSNKPPNTSADKLGQIYSSDTGLRGGFLSNLTNGVLGNFVWWIVFMLGVFMWQQFNSLKKPINPPVNLESVLGEPNISNNEGK